MDLSMVAAAAREAYSAFIRMAVARKSRPVALGEEQFTREEAAHIQELRRQYLAYPDTFKLDVNYPRARFIRWLVQRGYLREEIETSGDVCTSVNARNKWIQGHRWSE